MQNAGTNCFNCALLSQKHTEMVTLPAGTFTMGSPEDEVGRLPVEAAQHLEVVPHSFAVSKYPVTVDQFATFLWESGYKMNSECLQWDGMAWRMMPGSFLAPGFEQTGRHPAVCVSWYDAQAYLTWLSAATGAPCRLLTEPEWEYAARAGTATPYWWGVSPSPDWANYNLGLANISVESVMLQPRGTVSVDYFTPNPWGLYQMHGNIWEWVEECWSPLYSSVTASGGEGGARQDHERRVVRGGSWLNGGWGIRSARRHADRPDIRRSDIGFRVAMTLRDCC